MRTLVVILLLLGAVLVYRYGGYYGVRLKKRPTASRNSCINNLRQLDGAKEQWALETKATNGQPATVSAVLEYIKGQSMPICEQGGTYTIGNVGDLPTCTFPAHKL